MVRFHCVVVSEGARMYARGARFEITIFAIFRSQIRAQIDPKERAQDRVRHPPLLDGVLNQAK